MRATRSAGVWLFLLFPGFLLLTTPAARARDPGSTGGVTTPCTHCLTDDTGGTCLGVTDPFCDTGTVPREGCYTCDYFPPGPDGQSQEYWCSRGVALRDWTYNPCYGGTHGCRLGPVCGVA